jgi:hypothetical protein
VACTRNPLPRRGQGVSIAQSVYVNDELVEGLSSAEHRNKKFLKIATALRQITHTERHRLAAVSPNFGRTAHGTSVFSCWP